MAVKKKSVAKKKPRKRCKNCGCEPDVGMVMTSSQSHGNKASAPSTKDTFWQRVLRALGIGVIFMALNFGLSFEPAKAEHLMITRDDVGTLFTTYGIRVGKPLQFKKSDGQVHTWVVNGLQYSVAPSGLITIQIMPKLVQ